MNKANGLFTLHGTGTGNRKQWVSVLPYVLYTLHRNRDRVSLFSIVPIPVPVSVPFPVPCTVYEPLLFILHNGFLSCESTFTSSLQDHLIFLPAATKLGQGNKFTGVCLSTGGGGGVPGQVPGGVPGRFPPPPRPGTSPRTRYPPGLGTPPRTRYTPWIRTTSGRYASYWNAFLFLTNFYFDEIKGNLAFHNCRSVRRMSELLATRGLHPQHVQPSPRSSLW